MNPSFRPVKTGDIVYIQDVPHLVYGVDIQSSQIYLNVKEISPSVKKVMYNQISFAPEQQRLRAAKIAQEAMRHGYASGEKSIKSDDISQPFNTNEIAELLKNNYIKTIKSLNADCIDQEIVNKVVQKVAAAQGYLIARSHKSRVKSDMKYANWQNIANLALKIAHRYNQSVVNRNSSTD